MLRRVFGRPVTVLHVLLLNAATAAAVAVLVFVASGAGAATPAAFQPAGSFRMAAVQRTSIVRIDGTHSFRVLASLAFTVPAGKTADIQALYNATVQSETRDVGDDICSVFIRLDDDTLLMPGGVVVFDARTGMPDAPPYADDATVQGFINGVGVGSHTLAAVGTGTGATDCEFQQGSLTLTASIH
jgi:hypothetical protein